MRRGVNRSTRLVVVAVVAVTVTALAACGRSNSNSSSKTPTGGTSSSASASPTAAPGDFGTLKKICGPGNATGGSGRGISPTAIQLGTMSDTGSSVAPGLGQEFFDVGTAFVKWCNNAGGINGRKIVLTEYDAKLFNVAQQMIQACQKVFMLVGNGNGLDAPGATPRINCKLGQIPSYVVSPEATSAGLQVQPTPNPPTEFQVGPFRLLGLKYPQTKASGIAVGSSNTSSLRAQGLRTRDAVKDIGFKVADYSERPPLVTNWRPYMEEIKNSGAGGYMNATGSAAYIAPELTAMKDVGLKLTWMLLGNAYYEPQTIAAVKSVGLQQPTYQYFSHLPFEMTDQPARAGDQDHHELGPEGDIHGLHRPRVQRLVAVGQVGDRVRERPDPGMRPAKGRRKPELGRGWTVPAAQHRPEQQAPDAVLRDHGCHAERLRLRQGRHAAEQGHLQLRPVQRGDRQELPAGQLATTPPNAARPSNGARTGRVFVLMG